MYTSTNSRRSRQGIAHLHHSCTKGFFVLNSKALYLQTVKNHDEFLDSVKFNGERYEVSLPRRQTHEILRDNHELSGRRFHNQWRRLLEEYHADIQDQLAKGIIEEVANTNNVNVGCIHYLPHHAVVRQDKYTIKD